MGGIVTTGIAVNCDRCKKDVSVNDEKQALFYKSWSERGDKDDRMFVGVVNSPNTVAREVDFEYVCPKCDDEIGKLMDKIESKKPVKAKKETAKEDPKDTPRETPKDAGKETADDDEPGLDVVDDELFN